MGIADQSNVRCKAKLSLVDYHIHLMSWPLKKQTNKQTKKKKQLAHKEKILKIKSIKNNP
jgi:hypothetical protein